MLPITTTLLCIMALIHLGFSALIIKIRRTALIGLNHGNNERLGVLMRAQSNNIEYSIWLIPLLALQEHHGIVPSYGLWLIMAIYVISRAWHGWSFVTSNARKSYGRFWGTFAAINCIMLLVSANLYSIIIAA